MNTLPLTRRSAAERALSLRYASGLCGVLLVGGALLGQNLVHHSAAGSAPVAGVERPAMSKAVSPRPHYFYVVGSAEQEAAVRADFYNAERFEPNFDFVVIATRQDEQRLAATQREVVKLELQGIEQGDYRPGPVFVDLRGEPAVE